MDMDLTRHLIGLFLIVTHSRISLASHCEIIQSQENKGIADTNSDALIIDGSADSAEECVELCCDSDECNVVEFRSNVQNDQDNNNCFLYKCNPVDSCKLVDRNDTYVHLLNKYDQSKQTLPSRTTTTASVHEQSSNTKLQTTTNKSTASPTVSQKSADVKVHSTTKIIQSSSKTVSTKQQESQPTNATSTSPPITKSTSGAISRIINAQTTTVPTTTHKAETETNGDKKGVSETKKTFQTSKSPATPPTTVHKTTTATTTTTTSVAMETTTQSELNQTTISSNASSAQQPIAPHNVSSFSTLVTSTGQNNSIPHTVTTVAPAETTESVNETSKDTQDRENVTIASVVSTTFSSTLPTVQIDSPGTAKQNNASQKTPSTISLLLSSTIVPSDSLNSTTNIPGPDSTTKTLLITKVSSTTTNSQYSSSIQATTPVSPNQTQETNTSINISQSVITTTNHFDQSSQSLNESSTSGTIATANGISSSEEPSQNFTHSNSTFDKASAEETRSSHMLSVALIGALSFGIIFFIAVLGLAVKRCFDGWQRRHYSRIDYLVNGMYN